MSQVFIEPPDSPEHAGANEYVGGSGGHGVIRSKCRGDRGRSQWRRSSVNLQLRVHEHTPAIGPVAAGAPGTGELTMQFVRAPEVVIIAESDPVCGRFCRAKISCRTHALSHHVTRNPHA